MNRQGDDCAAVAQRRGGEGAEVYRGNDRRAKNAGNRPEFDRLLSDVLAGRVGVIVAWSWDRLSRNRRETLQLIEACQERGVLITLVKGSDIDCSPAAGRLTADILASVARNEIDVKSERQARKIEELVSKGLPLGGGRSFGYDSDGLTIRESEAQELRSIGRPGPGW